MRGGRRSKGPVPPVSSAPRHHLSVLFRASRTWLGCCSVLARSRRPTAHPESAIESGPLGRRDEGSSSRDGGSLDNLPKDCHGMSLSPSEWLHSQSRHSSLHLLGAHPPVNAVTAGRHGTCGRRRQGLLRPPSSVRLRGKRSVWATGCLCARPPSRRLFVDAEIRQRRGQDLDNCPRLT